jgi:5'-3' exonuclease
VTGKRHVYLVDASIYIFRAYFSLPDSLTDAGGNPINALQGFAGFLAGLLEDTGAEHMAVVFDESLTTSFRNDIYPEYKANRELPPPELERQFEGCRQLANVLGLPTFSSDTYEADDLIGTIATRMRAMDFINVIVTVDKDLAQLVGPGDMLWDYARNRKHFHKDIHAWLGVRADQVADYLALAGDAVDNIPGVPGIGPKTAAALLERFDSLPALLEQVDKVGEMKLRGAARIQKLLQEHREAALQARQLTGIVTDIDMQVGIRDVARRQASSDDVTAVCKELGLARMTQARLLKAINL